jgi:hypothetical protein
MKKILMLIVATLISVSLFSANTRAQEKMSAEEKAKRMAASYEIAGPGPEHKHLESRVGSWNQEIKYWMERDKPPMTINGTCENRMIMGGRFLSSECKSSVGGMTVESQAVIGFDRRHKRYTIVAVDSTATYYVAAAGPYDETRKAVVMSGEDYDPVLGGKQVYDFVMRDVSPDRYVSEVVFKDEAHTQGKGDFKMVEITFTRAKKETK